MPAAASLGGPSGFRKVVDIDPYTFVNAAPTIVTYTVPSDGRDHAIMIFGVVIITVAETGGAVNAAVTDAASGKSQPSVNLFPGGFGAGIVQLSWQPYILSPGSTIVVTQTALTVGAATMRFRIYQD